jgi:hypothetical protein
MTREYRLFGTVSGVRSFVVAKGSMLTFRAHIDIKEKRECYNERPDLPP